MRQFAFLDYLRCLAIIAVVFIHCTPISGMDFYSFEWKYNLPFNALSRCGVPLFFMISGALFLNPEKKIDCVYLKKKIIRIIICFFLFSLSYDILWYLNKYGFSYNKEAVLNVFIPALITGKYHLWYLAALISLYLLTPIFRAFSTDFKIVKYYLLVTFIVCSFLPVFYQLLELLGDYSYFEVVSNNMAFDLPSYSLYFVLGFYLTNISTPKYYRKLYLMCGVIISLLLMILGDFAITSMLEKPTILCSGYLSPLTVVYSSFIFLLIRLEITEQDPNVIVKIMAKYSLGIYLIHALFIDLLTTYGYLPVVILPLIMIPSIVIIVILLSAGTTCILKKISFLNRIL